MTPSAPRASKAKARNADAPFGSARTDDVRRAAAGLFTEHGYAATTMSDIAQAVGVLPGSLYHHFGAKEDIAVDLLLLCGDALGELARQAPAVPTDRESAEAGLRRLTTQVALLGYEHAAAVRLLAHEAPPTTSSDRFSEAMQQRVPAMERAWRNAVRPLGEFGTPLGADPALLRFALARLAFFAPVNYPADLDPAALVEHLLDLLLHGMMVDCPPDEELDASVAREAADDAIASWGDRDGSGVDDRELIVSAARSQFALRGYDATTIRDIAEAAGVSMGTLYRRIDSKEALLLEMLDRYSVRLGEAFKAVITSGAGVQEVLDALGRVFLRASRHYREEATVVNYGWGQRAAAGSPFHDYYLATEQRRNQWAELVRRGFREGSVRRVATPAETAFHFRNVLWVPYQDHARTSEARAHRFVRQSLWRGALTPA